MLAALPTAMWAAEKAYQTYRGVNATMTKARQFRRAPEQMRYLAQLCEALLAPLAVAEQLAVRHRALRIVGAAVILADNTIEQYDRLLPTGFDDSAESWEDWMKTGVEGVKREQQILDMQAALHRAMSALQLALAAVAVSTLPEPRFALSPFAYVRDAFEGAQKKFEELAEFRRTRRLLLCGGELWQRGSTTKAVGQSRQIESMRQLFPVAVHLQRGRWTGDDEKSDSESEGEGEGEEDEGEDGGDASEPASPANGTNGADAAEVLSPGAAAKAAADDDALTLRFEVRQEADADGGDGSGGEVEEDVSIGIDEHVLLRRWWATDLADDLPEAHKYEFLDVVGEEALCYEVRASTRQKPSPATRAHATLVLVFRFIGGGVSAEQFEALLAMALFTRQAKGVQPLSDVYDSGKVASMANFTEAMAKRIGPLRGAPAVGPSSARPPAVRTPGGLLSPMRGLALGGLPSSASSAEPSSLANSRAGNSAKAK